VRLLLAVIVWAVAAVGAVELSSSVARTVHNEQATTSTTTTATTSGASQTTSTSSSATPAPPFDPSAVKPTDPRSLFIGSNFSHTLTLARRRLGNNAQVERLEVFPGQVVMTVVKNDNEVNVIARVNGDYLSTAGGPVSSGAQAFTLSQVHTNVPRTLARRLAAHGQVPVSKLNFMQVRIDFTVHLFHWYVYPKQDSVYFQADSANGPIQRFNHGIPGKVIRG
jgi:hypothetical protein